MGVKNFVEKLNKQKKKGKSGGEQKARRCGTLGKSQPDRVCSQCNRSTDSLLIGCVPKAPAYRILYSIFDLGTFKFQFFFSSSFFLSFSLRFVSGLFGYGVWDWARIGFLPSFYLRFYRLVMVVPFKSRSSLFAEMQQIFGLQRTHEMFRTNAKNKHSLDLFIFVYFAFFGLCDGVAISHQRHANESTAHWLSLRTHKNKTHIHKHSHSLTEGERHRQKRQNVRYEHR